MQLPALEVERGGGALWGHASSKRPIFLFLLFAILFYFMNITTFTVCIMMN